ncbi:cation diffusion facilitator family transporter [Mesotoga sp. H07pep.5.4]|uniref:cation diffusion facilitator family transporter n=1 Tax=Mesotoga sp. H07pep.5.4 TaxID=1463664 RepID=UPI000EF13EF2|nr:cation diffusion facilitator family transporter [Mesotoga sp. H07pep.5.4]RLL85034.1 cation transporter [Mesotoga sp. H07pep.5.4]
MKNEENHSSFSQGFSNGHHHGNSFASNRKLIFSVFLNLTISITEVFGGLFSGSLALISDSLHNFGDTSSLFVSFIARKISRKERNSTYTYGYKRAEIIGATLNTIFLLAIAVFLFAEAIRKLLSPAEIKGELMFWVAIVGLVGNVITAFLLFSESKQNLNIRSAFIHIVSDTLSSVFVIIASLIIIRYDFLLLDPLLTIVVGAYICYQSIHLLKKTMQILMQGIPDDHSIEMVRTELEKLDFVHNAHHIHIWTSDGSDIYVEAHVQLTKEAENSKVSLDSYLEKVEQVLKQLRINHSTIQIENGRCNGGS